MTYVVPRTDLSKYSSIDFKSVPAGTAIQTSAAGIGYVDPQTNQFVVLDALPAARTSITDSIAKSDYINATAGFTAYDPLADTLNTAEAAALNGNSYTAYSIGSADTTAPIISGGFSSFTYSSGSVTNGDLIGAPFTANEAVTWSTNLPWMSINTSGQVFISDAATAASQPVAD